MKFIKIQRYVSTLERINWKLENFESRVLEGCRTRLIIKNRQSSSLINGLLIKQASSSLYAFKCDDSRIKTSVFHSIRLIRRNVDLVESIGTHSRVVWISLMQWLPNIDTQQVYGEISCQRWRDRPVDACVNVNRV